MASSQVASPSDYLKARLSLLEKEKDLTRLQDRIAKDRKSLPLVPVTKSYTFIDPNTNKELSLSDLFQNRKQLIVYHAMFSPDSEQACPSCTLLLDHIPHLEHLRSHNTNLVVVSRAKPEQIKAYKDKMGFDFPWFSSYGNDFNYDYHVSVDNDKNNEYNFKPSEHWKERGMDFFASGEQPGTSCFVLGGDTASGGVGRGGEPGQVYHFYSSYARGGEGFITTLKFLDFTPLGRQDGQLDGGTGVGYRRRGEYTEEQLGLTA